MRAWVEVRVLSKFQMFLVDKTMKMFVKSSVTLTNEFQNLEVIWDVEPLRL